MNVFIAWDGDHIGRQVGRASLNDDAEGLRRISQAIDHGNTIWKSWVESHGGNIISMGGDEGRAEMPADYLDELPKIREQYQGAVGSTVSVGVGVKLSEADRALIAAKLRGGDRIEFYTDEVNAVVARAEAQGQKTEEQKIADEYLNKGEGKPRHCVGCGDNKDKTTVRRPTLGNKPYCSTCWEAAKRDQKDLNKAAPAMHAGAFAGVTEPAGPTMSKPVATQGDHEEAADVADQQENSGQSPELTSAGDDFASQFHDAASAQEQEDTEGHARATKNIDDVKKKLVVALQMLKQQAPMLEQIKQAAPDAYQAIIGLTQAVIGLSREIQAVSPMKKSEVEWLDPLLKEENKLDFKRLIHFSVKPGLKQISVDKMGTGARGAEYKQGVPEVGRAYYYAHGSTPEPLVTQGAKAKYEATLDPVKHRLYDVGLDPEGLRGASREKFLAGEGLESPEDTFLHEVKSRGYYGYHNSRSSLPHAVALFHPHPVKPLGKAENPQNSMVNAVRGALTDDLRKKPYRGAENCMAGHCYVASEALYHLLGGKEAGWTPMHISHEGGPHWFLKNRHNGKVIDATADQFETPVPYHLGKGKGFLTALPSKRANTVISRVLTKKGEMEPDESAHDNDDLEKAKLPMPGASAHHHVTLPVGSTNEQKVKVQHSDGKQGWVSVQAGQVRSQDPNGHPISSRNPGGK